MAEALGVVAAALQLVGLAKKAYEFFQDMSKDFKDRDGKASDIRHELSSFKASAKFAHENLKKSGGEGRSLLADIHRCQKTISELGKHMQTIRGKKRKLGFFRETSYWMKIMQNDGDVQKLRSQIREHTMMLLTKFEAHMLVKLSDDLVKLSATEQIHHDQNMFQHKQATLHRQASDESIKAIESKLNEVHTLVGNLPNEISTPAMSTVDLDNDNIFDFDSPPGSPYQSPPRSPSPEASISFQSSTPSDTDSMHHRRIVRRRSSDLAACCTDSDCSRESFEEYPGGIYHMRSPPRS